MDASISRQVEEHIRNKQAHLFKFSSFCRKNADAPYTVKKLVWNSCMLSAVLYSCETWLTQNMSCVSRPYLRSIKEMVCVRPQTCTSALLLETGICEPKAQILSRQRNFLMKLQAAPHFPGSPVEQAIQMARESRCPMGRHIQYLTELQQCPISANQSHHQTAIMSSDSSRRMAYRLINPGLTVHPLYTAKSICEVERISTSRRRLGSHRLKIETGRWSRIPRTVQDEPHVLLVCHHLDFSSLGTLMDGDPQYVVPYCHKVLGVAS